MLEKEFLRLIFSHFNFTMPSIQYLPYSIKDKKSPRRIIHFFLICVIFFKNGFFLMIPLVLSTMSFVFGVWA
jgi:hypothetical protein